MLEFFRKYQRYLFFVVTVVVITSFIFFGAFSTFGGNEERPDKEIGKTIDGRPMMLLEVQKLSRFLASDREDAGSGGRSNPNFCNANFCNDGVIRYDFIRDGLADPIVFEYFDLLKGDFEKRLEKAKRFQPYVHPEAPFLSAKNVWDHFTPDLNGEIEALQKEPSANFDVFSHLEKLYLYQCRLHPEMLRQILVYQHRQYPWLQVDQRLSYEDLALFGYHSAADWFGHNFVDLVAEFILNAAALAVEKGYQVSLQEAKGELIHNFQETVEKAKLKTPISFQEHLHRLGFDEKTAAELWRKVLLFRKYFQDVGNASFVDRLPYKGFAGYANETVVVESYRWPIQLKSADDLAQLQFYMRAISNDFNHQGLPKTVLSLEEIEKKVPELVQKTVRANVAEVSKKQVALRASVKEVWDFELQDANWELLRKEFSLPKKETREERFEALERSEKRAEIDAWARNRLVDENPEWVEEALRAAPLKEKTWQVLGNEEPTLKEEGVYFRMEDLEIVKDKHILTFNEARQILSKLDLKGPKAEGEFNKDKTPFAKASQDALLAVQKKRGDPNWIQSKVDPILDQFKLETKEERFLRTSQEDWMKEQAFMLMPDSWSPIHIADHGEIVFFYVQEKKTDTAPILEGLSFGKETLAADAKIYLTERLLETIKRKQGIVIPVQKEDE